jgi:predicted component of type VI protein secretion system
VEKQAELENQCRAIQAMRGSVPADVVAPFEKVIGELDRDEEALTQKYSILQAPSLQQWESFERDLDSLISRSAKVYWELKFHVLLND